MKLHYDAETDSLYIELSAKPGIDSHEIRDGLVVDLDAEGNRVGIDIEYVSKQLSDAGIVTTDRPLDRGATPKGPGDLAENLGISPKLILKWVNHADLFRIKGVAGEYAELLEAAGVDTVPELAQRDAANLHQKIAETNEQKRLVRQVPSEGQVASWVEQAKKLDLVSDSSRPRSPTKGRPATSLSP